MKQTIYSVTAGNMTFSGSIACLTDNIVRGDSFDQSTGLLIKPMELHLRATVKSVVGSYNTCRLVIFQWNDAGTPVASNLLASVGTQIAPYSPYTWVNRNRFTVMHDSLFTVHANSSATLGCKDVNLHLKDCFRALHLGASGAGTVPTRNGIFIMLFGDDGLTPYPTIDYQCELLYTDA